VFGLYQVFGRELCETYALMALEMGRSSCAWVSCLGGISGMGHAGGLVWREQLLSDGCTYENIVTRTFADPRTLE